MFIYGPSRYVSHVAKAFGITKFINPNDSNEPIQQVYSSIKLYTVLLLHSKSKFELQKLRLNLASM